MGGETGTGTTRPISATHHIPQRHRLFCLIAYCLAHWVFMRLTGFQEAGLIISSHLTDEKTEPPQLPQVVGGMLLNILA